MLQAQYAKERARPFLEQPCSKHPLGFSGSVSQSPSRAGMLASMQRKTTNGISLIRASGSLPPKRRHRQLTISDWPGQSSSLRGDGEQGQMHPVPNTHSLLQPTPLFHAQTKCRRQDMTVGEIIVAFLHTHVAPYDIRDTRDLAVEKSRGPNAFPGEEV